MHSYFIKRLLLIVPTLLGISAISFAIIQLAPGDPAQVDSGGDQTVARQIVEETRAIYGLDQPLHIQYWRWLKRMLTFDFGYSIRDHRPVWDKLKEALPASVLLGSLSLFFAYLISIPAGIYSATHQHSRADKAMTVALFGLYSLPNFWIATMAIIYLGGGFLDIFPVTDLHSRGYQRWSWWMQLQDLAWHAVLPVACMTYYLLAILSRYMRASMLEVIRQDFIRTARAKGLSERIVVYRHALRNSLIPIVTLTADLVPVLIGGSVVIEFIFSIPGLGQLSYQSIQNRDYPVIMAVFTLSALLTLVLILIADFFYTIIDPRIAYERKAA